MKKTILFFFFLIATFAHAQILFHETLIVNDGASLGLGGVQSPDGGYIFGSRFYHNLIHGPMISKFDSSGLEVWNKTLNSDLIGTGKFILN